MVPYPQASNVITGGAPTANTNNNISTIGMTAAQQPATTAPVPVTIAPAASASLSTTPAAAAAAAAAATAALAVASGMARQIQQQPLAAPACSTLPYAYSTAAPAPQHSVLLPGGGHAAALPPAPPQTTVTETPSVFQNMKLRRGKWTQEEEDYAAYLIQEFEKGTISGCENGCTLRAFLSKKLHCAPMRISKKYAGKSIGKHVFLSRKPGNTIPGITTSTRAVGDNGEKLRHLEIKFYKSLFQDTDATTPGVTLSSAYPLVAPYSTRTAPTALATPNIYAAHQPMHYALGQYAPHAVAHTVTGQVLPATNTAGAPAPVAIWPPSIAPATGAHQQPTNSQQPAASADNTKSLHQSYVDAMNQMQMNFAAAVAAPPPAAARPSEPQAKAPHHPAQTAQPNAAVQPAAVPPKTATTPQHGFHQVQAKQGKSPAVNGGAPTVQQQAPATQPRKQTPAYVQQMSIRPVPLAPHPAPLEKPQPLAPPPAKPQGTTHQVVPSVAGPNQPSSNKLLHHVHSVEQKQMQPSNGSSTSATVSSSKGKTTTESSQPVPPKEGVKKASSQGNWFGGNVGSSKDETPSGNLSHLANMHNEIPDILSGFDRVTANSKLLNSAEPKASQQPANHPFDEAFFPNQYSPPFTSRSFDDFHQLLGKDLQPLHGADSQDKQAKTSTMSQAVSNSVPQPALGQDRMKTGANNSQISDLCSSITADAYAMFAQESALAVSQHSAYCRADSLPPPRSNSQGRPVAVVAEDSNSEKSAGNIHGVPHQSTVVNAVNLRAHAKATEQASRNTSSLGNKRQGIPSTRGFLRRNPHIVSASERSNSDMGTEESESSALGSSRGSGSESTDPSDNTSNDSDSNSDEGPCRKKQKPCREEAKRERTSLRQDSQVLSSIALDPSSSHRGSDAL